MRLDNLPTPPERPTPCEDAYPDWAWFLQEWKEFQKDIYIYIDNHPGGGGSGVTQAYVDTQDRKILNESKSFTESKFSNIPLMTTYATCDAEAAPSKTAPVTWYIPKTMPKPSGTVGMMIDVFWQNGRADGIGYDISLVWGAPGDSDNVVIVPTAPTSDSLTGQYSIPAEGTVRYQLIEQSGRKRWQYVSGKLISKQFSTATAADTADKSVHGMEISYLPGMEIFLQMDHGNTADVMRLVPDAGETLPVYGNGVGAKTGPIPAGYILHLKNAGDHWQILNYYAAENYEESAEPTAELKANVFHKFTAPAETITVTVAPATGYAEYGFQYTTASSGGNLSIPADFAWNGGKAPELKPNMTYQVVLFSGTAYISGGVPV